MARRTPRKEWTRSELERLWEGIMQGESFSDLKTRFPSQGYNSVQPKAKQLSLTTVPTPQHTFVKSLTMLHHGRVLPFHMQALRIFHSLKLFQN